ncbi:PhzF family phenazine biosynthesis protein [Haematomicrobium sanguinis]|uniref:PhzF family phenazine biosynthesis protein n=1 Tax=Haematomicrobium sanguinis TaxID=479106 RepID=UPI00047B1C1D|nr:PhzF family phenazine biosynthesis protein [Haematomicrobium sanguinis]
MDVVKYAAFTREGMGGNPAGIVLDARGLDDASMLGIAADVGFAETVFVIEPNVGGNGRLQRVRYFSPSAVVPFCGHATVALAVSLSETGETGDYRFLTPVGEITISTERVGGKVKASFASVEPHVRDLDDRALAEVLALLGLGRDAIDDRFPPKEAFAGNWHPNIVLSRREDFDGFTFDGAAMSEIMRRNNWTGTVSVLRYLGVGEDGVEVFEARNLFPVGAMLEDPATGSAAASTGAYLRAIGRVAPPARVRIYQGENLGRPSELIADVPESGGITVSGFATRL